MSALIPNLFLIGAPKSGTTAMADGLSQHPNIFVGIKEPRYFDAHVFYDSREDYPIKSYGEYLDLYKNACEVHQYLVDASVFNMYSEESVKNILLRSPHAKFIVILRDPLTASKSMHSQRLKYIDSGMREVSERFCVCWDLVSERRKGRGYPEGCKNKFLFRYDLLYSYDLYIDMLIGYIGRQNILFIGYDEYKSKSSDVYKQVFNFLDVPSIDVKNNLMNDSNKLMSNSIWNRFLFLTAAITRSMRKKVGLQGNNIVVFKKLFSYNRKPIDSGICDDEVRKYFHKSYAKMKDVLNDNE